MSDIISTGDAAKELGCQRWLVARLIDGGLPDTARVGGHRVVHKRDIPKIRRLLEAYRKATRREPAAASA